MILPIKKQVVSLELSKKLKTLGVKQESVWWWLNTDDDEMICSFFEEDATSLFEDIDFPKDSKNEYIQHVLKRRKEKEICLHCGNKKKQELRQDFASAFTVAELGNKLPDEIEKDGQIFSFYAMKDSRGHLVGYADEDIDPCLGGTVLMSHFINEFEAIAKGSLLVYLLENKLVKAEGI